jgi:hypothetical protein
MSNAMATPTGELHRRRSSDVYYEAVRLVVAHGAKLDPAGSRRTTADMLTVLGHQLDAAADNRQGLSDR